MIMADMFLRVAYDMAGFWKTRGDTIVGEFTTRVLRC